MTISLEILAKLGLTVTLAFSPADDHDGFTQTYEAPPRGYPPLTQVWRCDDPECDLPYYVIPGNTHQEMLYHKVMRHGDGVWPPA